VSNESGDSEIYVQRHLRVGWWAFFLFAAMGLILESLQGFKVRAYLDVSNDTRRLMWRLAHAHGTLLSLVNVVVGLQIRVLPEVGAASRRMTSAALLAATGLIPGGFFLGGIVFYGGDPGLGVLILPIGAICLLAAALLLARGTGSASAPGADRPARNARPPKR
jgi:hypothetical protein